MRLALYCPNYGFYETEADIIGRKGSFYTSVSVGELFGQLLAFQFSEWLSQAGAADEAAAGTGKLQLVEAGAHDGSLGRDILNWLRKHRGGIFERVEYCVLEPSARRRARQAAVLQEFGNRVRWMNEWDDFCRDGVGGVIFSNELLDAMPVHRISWDAKQGKWLEWGVVSKDERFEWAKMRADEGFDLSETCLEQLPAGLLEILPDGFTTEVCPDSVRWWKSAAGVLRWGRLMTIDYGF